MVHRHQHDVIVGRHAKQARPKERTDDEIERPDGLFHRQGEIRDRTFENQSFRASGLSLITAAIVHWNTVYLDRVVQHVRTQGAIIPDDLLAHVAPLGWEHIALTGDYVWTDSSAITGFRPIRDIPAAFLSRAA